MTEENFPSGITEKGTEEGEFLFLSRTISGKKTIDTLMRAQKDGIEEVSDSDFAKGMNLPVYMKPMRTQIYTGKMQVFA